MNNKKIFISFIIILIFCLSSNIKALEKTDFISPWNEMYSIDDADLGNYTIKVVEANNGFIRIGQTNDNNAYISKIDLNGKIVWKEVIEDVKAYDILVIDNDVYIALADNTKFSVILRMNESSGEIIDESRISDSSYFVNYQTIIRLYEYDNKIYSILSYLNIPSEIIEYNPKERGYKIPTLSDVPLEKILGTDMNLINYSYNNYTNNIKDYNWPTYYYWKKGIKIGDYYYMIAASPNTDDSYYQNQGLVIKLDSKGNYVSHIVLKDTFELTDIETNGNFIFISGNSIKDEKMTGYVYTLNQSLEIKDTTNVETLYNDPNPTYTMATSLLASSKGLLVAGIGENQNSGDGYIWGITYPYNIVTTTTGKGTINVKPSAFGGESVTFEIVPEKGYVLGVVKVTDANGNVLTFTSNTFTMPNADVTIEVTFLPENPNTSSKNIIILFGILAFGGISLYINLKKLEKEKI